MWAAPSAGSMIHVLALKILMLAHHVVSVRMFREVYDEFIGHCCIIDLHVYAIFRRKLSLCVALALIASVDK